MTSIRPLLATVSVLLALVLAACGSGDDGGGLTGTAGGGADGPFPVTVRTKEGPQTVERAPRRVVALDYASADALLAVGVAPIAMARVSYVDGGVQAWTRAALDGATPQLLNVDTGIPLERIAELRPDLIVASNTYELDAVHAELEQLAPVITYRRGPGIDTWQQTTRLVGRAVGRDAEARRVVADTEAAVARARREHPALRGRTVTLFNVVQGKAYAIADPRDFSMRFLSSLGLRLSPAIARMEDRSQRLEVSAERLGLLDADVVLGTTPGAPAALASFVDSPLFRRLPAVRRGAYASIGIGAATSIAFPSALSIRSALDELAPLLDRLASRAG